MAQLAIKGHETRGKEVIELLKMMGGNNYANHSGDRNVLYFIHNSGEILADFDCYYSNYTVFTIEEFLTKYPFKVGDKVLIPEYESEVCICKMQWNSLCNYMEYMVYCNDDEEWYCAEELLKYNNDFLDDKHFNKEETMEILNQLIEYFKNTPRDIIEKDWHEYDKYNEIGPTVKEYLESINKPKYPKTYEECCDILGIDVSRDIEHTEHLPFYRDINQYDVGLLECLIQFRKLLICRDAYWKIAGKQMGLSKSWEPDWKDESEFYYTISYNGVNIRCYNYTDVYSKIVFPTAEMRDAFYDNFKELIENCKELL